jgi:glycine betaine/proline transport system substrate-binding protein
MNTKLKTHVLAAAVSVIAMPAFAAEEVKIGLPSWTGAQAIGHLLGEIVTSRIGGTVEYVPGNNATIFQAMDQGKGDIDVHPDVWLPNQQSFTNFVFQPLRGQSRFLRQQRFWHGQQHYGYR